jgi:hypothetical protein
LYHFELSYPHEQVIDAAAAKAADAAAGGRAATIPAPVEQLMALIFDLEMMRKASAQLCELGRLIWRKSNGAERPGKGIPRAQGERQGVVPSRRSERDSDD